MEIIEYKRLKKARLRIKKIGRLEKIYVKDMLSKIKELEEIGTKLEELETKILRKRYRSETIGLETLTEQEIKLKAKKPPKNRRYNKRA